MSREKLERCLNAATEGDPEASYQLALLYLHGSDDGDGDYDDDNGHHHHQLSLVEKDEQLAMTYMRHAADSGVVAAQIKMAQCFQMGIADRWPRDTSEAIYYYRLGVIIIMHYIYLPIYLLLLLI